jgi:hypothetical protein
LRVSLKDLWSVRRCSNFSGEVFSGEMPLHMGPCPPETALRHIVYFALEGDVDRFSVFSIKRQEFFRGDLSHFLFLI